jgi:hypothetical protein
MRAAKTGSFANTEVRSLITPFSPNGGWGGRFRLPTRAPAGIQVRGRLPFIKILYNRTRRGMMQSRSCGSETVVTACGGVLHVFAKKSRRTSSLDIELGKKRHRELLERRK